jgi:hypothetical protein
LSIVATAIDVDNVAVDVSAVDVLLLLLVLN